MTDGGGESGPGEFPDKDEYLVEYRGIGGPVIAIGGKKKSDRMLDGRTWIKFQKSTGVEMPSKFQKRNQGDRNGNSKLTESEVYDIRVMACCGIKYRHIAEKFGVSVASVKKIAVGKTWKHVGGPMTTEMNATKKNG